MRYSLPLGSLLVLASCFITQSALPQGALAPPVGSPAPTMKTLDQIASTGIAINATNTPGNGSAIFVITSPGSYFLTGNITGASGKNGILISSSNVTVDLNGFALLGNGSGLAGITDGGITQGNAIIRHGSISGWGGAGVTMGSSFDSIVADLIVTNNSGVGLSLGDASVARDCVVRDNTGNNIVTGFNANSATAQPSAAPLATVLISARIARRTVAWPTSTSSREFSRLPAARFPMPR